MQETATGAGMLTAAEFFARARARLTLDVPAALTDAEHHAPARRPRRRSGDAEDRRGAADPPGGGAGAGGRSCREPTVLLTQRAQHLPDHPGQVSFPGGKIDKTDASPLDSALREAEEEIGLDRSFVAPLGYLDLYMTTLGYRIVPVIARVKPGFALTLNDGRGGRQCSKCRSLI